jgi:putative addiction module component (TIGR02574 family)
MSSLLTELTERAQQLSAQERAQLAQGLLESLQDVAPPEVEAAWDAEILNRIAEYERGDAVLVPAGDVFAQARQFSM